MARAHRLPIHSSILESVRSKVRVPLGLQETRQSPKSTKDVGGGQRRWGKTRVSSAETKERVCAREACLVGELMGFGTEEFDVDGHVNVAGGEGESRVRVSVAQTQGGCCWRGGWEARREARREVGVRWVGWERTRRRR